MSNALSANQTPAIATMTVDPPASTRRRYAQVDRSANATGRNAATIAIWPNSTPPLKPASDNASDPGGKPRSCNAPAKPKPCSNPNANAAIQRPRSTIGKMLFSAASTTESAIADSTQREGRETSPSAASVNVIECATVNAVTILATSQNDPLKSAAACQW